MLKRGKAVEFFELRSVEEARSILLEAAREHRVGPERVPTSQALGRITAEAVRAAEDLPPFARSSVDGYAVRSADTFGASEGLPAYLRVSAEILMGHAPTLPLVPTEAQKIATGGALPEGADAVVMVEYTEQSAVDEIAVLRPVSPGENVMQRGEDCRSGDVLIPAGQLIRAQEAALLSHAGVQELTVVRRPRVAIISTGDELVPADQVPGPGQIRESNGQALTALVRRDGGEPAYLGLAADDEAAISALLQQGMSCDLILVSGGSSVGTRDVTSILIDRLGQPGVLVHGVKLKPGKPTILAMADGVPVIGLPGHPVSAQVVYGLFVQPLLRQMQGLPPEPEFRPAVRARMTKNVASATGRYDAVRVRLFRKDGEVWAEPMHGKSGLISTLVKADGLVAIPSAREGLLAGEEVEVEVLA